MGIIDEEGNFPKSRQAFSADAVATMFGSIFGLCPVTSYIESGSGVEAGAKTGMTAVICSFYFFLSIFFAPIIASIPPWATGGALVVVGSMMGRSLAKLQWDRVSHAVSGFLTLIIMPLTYSIAYGLIAGIGAYIVMEGTFWLLSFAGVPRPGEKGPPRMAIGESIINPKPGSAAAGAAENEEEEEGEEVAQNEEAPEPDEETAEHEGSDDAPAEPAKEES